LSAVSATLGALPPRTPRPSYAAERAVAFPSPPFFKVYTVPTEIPKAVVALYWPTTDGWDIQRRRRLSLLGEIFSDRLRVRIREQLGGSYSPEAGSVLSETFKGYGFMIAEVIVAPERARELSAAVLRVAGDLQREGVTPDSGRSWRNARSIRNGWTGRAPSSPITRR